MTFGERYSRIYRRAFEFHKRHAGAETEEDFERMAHDEQLHCPERPEFAAALFWAAVDEIRRGIGKEGEKA